MHFPLPRVSTNRISLSSRSRPQERVKRSDFSSESRPPSPSPSSSRDDDNRRDFPQRSPATVSSSTATDNQSVLALFKEDYVFARVYMKEMDFKKALKKALERHMYKWYAIILIAIVLTALITIKHDTVVEFCEPVTRTIRNWPAGWLVPIAVLIVLSFPPLVGHEIIGILCGLVWGLWEGFGILAAGTFIGEIATWVAFKWCCQARATKFEKKNKLYSSLTQLIREKSFTFVLILRFSAVPGHITTAVSASAGANFWLYLLAAFLTLPKQWTIVYLGKAFGSSSRINTIISALCTVLTIFMTVVAAVYIYYQMRLVMRRQAIDALDAGIDTAVTSVTLSDFTDEKRESGLHSRRPWLPTNASVGGYRTPTRPLSMPGHMNDEELKEWLRELEEERVMANAANSHVGAIGVAEGAPAIKVDGVNVLESLPSTFSPPASPKITSPPTHPAVTAISPIPSLYELNNSYPPTIGSRASSTGRRTPSISSIYDFAGPSTPRLQGGREIADEADAYALAHGGKRPDYRRMRGDSRAALLGRPVDDAALDLGGPSWKREYTGRARGDSGTSSFGRSMFDELGRARGDSAAATFSRPTLEDLGVVRGDNGWVREGHGDHGRSRGNSAVALLGRPDDLGLGNGHSRRGSDMGSVRGGDIWEVLREDAEWEREVRYDRKGDENV